MHWAGPQEGDLKHTGGLLSCCGKPTPLLDGVGQAGAAETPTLQ